MNTFITFRTYGSWLHGDERGSVDKNHNQSGEPLIEPAPALLAARKRLMNSSPVVLGRSSRALVDATIREVAQHREWTILALNVLSNHVHVVVTASDDVNADKVMSDFKSWSTRRLREQGLVKPETRVWAEHGSTRYLTSPSAVYGACDYVNSSQGEAPARRTEPEG